MKFCVAFFFGKIQYQFSRIQFFKFLKAALNILLCFASQSSWECKSANGKSVNFDKRRDEKLMCINTAFKMDVGNFYFEIDVEDATQDFAIGVTSDGVFKNNLFRGLFYNYHLTDGHSVLKRYFGRTLGLRKRDKIKVTVLKTANKVDIYLNHNDASLGHAFEVNNPPSTLVPANIIRPLTKITNFWNTLMTQVPQVAKRHILSGIYEIISATKEGNTDNDCNFKTIEIFGPPTEELQDVDSHNTMNYFVDIEESWILTKHNKQWSFKKQKQCMEVVIDVLNNVDSVSVNGVELFVKGKGNVEKSFKAKNLNADPVTENVFLEKF